MSADSSPRGTTSTIPLCRVFSCVCVSGTRTHDSSRRMLLLEVVKLCGKAKGQERFGFLLEAVAGCSERALVLDRSNSWQWMRSHPVSFRLGIRHRCAHALEYECVQQRDDAGRSKGGSVQPVFGIASGPCGGLDIVHGGCTDSLVRTLGEESRKKYP